MSTAAFKHDRKLVWLASYPKSGNTWLRSLLTACLLPDDEFDLNAMVGEHNPFDRQALDDHAGISSADYLPNELLPYQAQMHRDMARESSHWRLIKTHSAYLKAATGEALFPAPASAGAVIIVRDPIDIVPSYAHHENKDFDWVIAHMRDERAGTDSWRHRSSTMLPQIMASWSTNVRSWLDQTEIPTLLLQYEDLHRDAQASLIKVLRFLSIDVDLDRIAYAVDRCRFDQLRSDEERVGFNERPSAERTFFRSGVVGDGAKALSDDQISAIVEDHHAVMDMVGYAVKPSDQQT